MPEDPREALKARLLDSFDRQGFVIENDRLLLSNAHKQALRAAHAVAVKHNIERARGGLARHEDRLLTHIARGMEVEPERIRPRLVEVQPDSEEELLFRYARLHWSIPVSAGYGRRLRFIVIDEANDKLVGLIGLADPVFSLGGRDRWVGWDKEAKKARLVHVMDLFVLGSVPPYSRLLCGKLVALLATSRIVQGAFARRYENRYTQIARKRFDGRLALLTTTSALGRSSIYNRLRFNGELVYKPVGVTLGSGDFHFYNGIYRELREFVMTVSKPSAKNSKWGTGFRNRREVVLKGLSQLSWPRQLIYHGVGREIFVVPLAPDSRAFLLGDTDDVNPYAWNTDDLFASFRERWLLPRARTDQRYLTFNPEDWRLWAKHA